MGKGTLVHRLVDHDDRLWLSRSWTTRPRRPSESPEAYNFVDRADFEGRVKAGGFLEWDEHFGNLYGTPIPDAPPDKDVLLEIDVNGAFQIRERIPDAVILLIAPPSRQAVRERLLQRGDDAEDVEARLARADMELERGRTVADYVIVNDDLTRATDEVAGILEKHRNPGGTP